LNSVFSGGKRIEADFIVVVRLGFNCVYLVPSTSSGKLRIALRIVPMKKRKFSTCFPMARIKKIIQADENIGKVSSATPAVLSACVEIFLKEICTKSVETTRSKGSNLLIPSHVESCVSENASFSFLKQTVKEARSSEKRSKASLGMDVVEENSTNS